jgi:hypothetical protein
MPIRERAASARSGRSLASTRRSVSSESIANGASMGANDRTPSVSSARADTRANSSPPPRTSAIVRASESGSSERQCVRGSMRVGASAIRATASA